LQVQSFPPVVDASSQTLVLGSMPGKVSLRAAEYYAHPRNLFWSFMERIFGIDSSASYEERVALLLQHGVALWDVLKSCTRESSLDSDIVPSSIVPNEFSSFFREHPSIRTVCFNGAKAADAFTKHVLAGLGELQITFHHLPSTSPANASIPFDRKLEAWGVVAPAAPDKALQAPGP
jgi:TDG/mug DNA glycosylase family protein